MDRDQHLSPAKNHCVDVNLWHGVGQCTRWYMRGYRLVCPANLLSVSEMALRFEASCPQGLCPGWSVIIKGETSSTENDFEINFLSDSGDQIAFHFNPRFPEGSIICNSFLSSHWGHEERTDTFPMEANEPFQIEIFSDRENFQVFVDDSKVIQYRHRMKQFTAITKVQVLKDINISSVEISRREMY
ncbi:grifin [Dendrobates tinctorius]|uniref:grifin n=1 Tax=Dendrobates tinctorius TaxID=92724 RepID=UPI003CC9AAAD